MLQHDKEMLYKDVGSVLKTDPTSFDLLYLNHDIGSYRVSDAGEYVTCLQF